MRRLLVFALAAIGLMAATSHPGSCTGVNGSNLANGSNLNDGAALSLSGVLLPARAA